MKKFFIISLFILKNICYSQDLLIAEIDPLRFNKDFSEYCQETSLYCAQISEIAYWNERNIKILQKQANEKYPEYNIKYKLIDDSYGIHHNQVLLWGNKDFLVVAFRGTEPNKLKDWFTDSKYWNYENSDGFHEELSNMPAGHGGFRRSLMRLLVEKKLIEEIKSTIKEISPNSSLESFPIYLTGHSMGAALSQLFILPLKHNKLNFSGAYHFAPPLAVSCEINKQMREKFGSITYDVVNYKDYVPRAGRNNVAHFGKFYRICNDGLIYEEKESYVKFNLSEYFTEFKLHALNTHIELLRKKENDLKFIRQRSTGNFPCMEIKGEIQQLCK